MISQVNDNCLPVSDTLEKSPLELVFRDSLREFYWSKNQRMRTLLKLENVALNGQLRRRIREYFETCRAQLYSVEHVFELLDEIAEGQRCALTESSCRNAMAVLNTTGSGGNDKAIRSSLAEFFAHEITALEYLMNQAFAMDRIDLARIIREMQRKTQAAFETSFQISLNNTDIAA